MICTGCAFNDIETEYQNEMEAVVAETDDVIDEDSEDKVMITTITVGEGEQYEDIKSALDNITENSYYNRYIVDVLPGVYDYSDDMDIRYIGLKNYVYIKGRNPGECIVINKYADEKCDWDYSVFDPNGYVEAIEEAEISNLTIVSRGGKCPIHIDTDYDHFANGGVITIDNCILLDLNNPEMEGYKGGYAGGVNVGMLPGQHVIVKNCKSNGCIYAHNQSNQNVDEGCYFEISNCIFATSALVDCCSNSNDEAYIHDCKFDFLNLSVLTNEYDIGKYNWNIVLEGNDIEQIYSTVAGDQTFWERYFGGHFAITESRIHDFCYNISEYPIKNGEYVNLASYTEANPVFGRGITRTDSGKVYAQALEDIEPGCFGVVQYSGIIDIQVVGTVEIGDLLLLNSDGYFEKSEMGDMIAVQSYSGDGIGHIKARFE